MDRRSHGDHFIELVHVGVRELGQIEVRVRQFFVGDAQVNLGQHLSDAPLPTELLGDSQAEQALRGHLFGEVPRELLAVCAVEITLAEWCREIPYPSGKFVVFGCEEDGWMQGVRARGHVVLLWSIRAWSRMLGLAGRIRAGRNRMSSSCQFVGDRVRFGPRGISMVATTNFEKNRNERSVMSKTGESVRCGSPASILVDREEHTSELQ